ncbi:MAG: hypothetical protein ACRBDL_01520 [Alphaproteobacteria bacterium]
MQKNIRVVFDPQTFDSSVNDNVKSTPLLGSFFDSSAKSDGSIPVLHIGLSGDENNPDVDFSLGGQTISMKASEYLTAVESHYANQHDFAAQHSEDIGTLSQNFQEEGGPFHEEPASILQALETQARAGHLARSLSPLMEAEDFYFLGLSGALYDALPQDLKDNVTKDMIDRLAANAEQRNNFD